MPQLNLTRDQLASFLKNQQQIRQFELLFQNVDEVVSNETMDFTSLTASANESLAQINSLAQNFGVEINAADQKATQALDDIKTLQELYSLFNEANLKAIEALDGINSLLNLSTSINSADQKATMALDAIKSLQNAIDIISIIPIRYNIVLSSDVSGILPYSNQTPIVRSNQVLTWLSM